MALVRWSKNISSPFIRPLLHRTGEQDNSTIYGSSSLLFIQGGLTAHRKHPSTYFLCGTNNVLIQQSFVKLLNHEDYIQVPKSWGIQLRFANKNCCCVRDASPNTLGNRSLFELISCPTSINFNGNLLVRYLKAILWSLLCGHFLSL